MTPGDTLPELVRHLDAASLVAYAGATWDWHRMHHDQEWAATRGFAAAVVDGQVFGAFLADQLATGCGVDAFVESLDFRFRSMVHAGETVTCRATCSDVANGVALFQMEVVVTGPLDGQPADRVAVTATGTVRL